jgi:acyl-CoA synthetase (AMP-forming)/AMP-acid ligase II
MFMVAFYGCLLAELIPVPIEVPLTRKVRTGEGRGHGLVLWFLPAL